MQQLILYQVFKLKFCNGVVQLWFNGYFRPVAYVVEFREIVEVKSRHISSVDLNFLYRRCSEAMLKSKFTLINVRLPKNRFYLMGNIFFLYHELLRSNYRFT